MGPKNLHMGTGLVLRPNRPRGQATKTVSEFVKEESVYICVIVSLYVCECDSRRGEWGLAGSGEDVNVSLRWQQQHSHTQACV